MRGETTTHIIISLLSPLLCNLPDILLIAIRPYYKGEQMMKNESLHKNGNLNNSQKYENDQNAQITKQEK